MPQTVIGLRWMSRDFFGCRAFVVGEDLEYCWRCYGVTEAPRREATGALSMTWEPDHEAEDYASRADVGSFAPPPPAERTRQTPPRKPARVKPEDWRANTGGRPS